MLKALSDRSITEMRGLLSRATLSLMPHPKEVVVEDDVIAVLSEVRERLRISPTDVSPEARTRLQTFLGDLLADQLLPKSEQSAIRRRLGDKGLLEPNQFDLQRNRALTARGAVYRVRWSHIEDAVQHADVVEHFRMVEGVKDVPFTSLFMRRPPPRAAASEFWWLIDCHRDGASMFPKHAWRLFDDTFDFGAIKTPREAITQFAQKFGQDLKIADKQMRIAFREVVPSAAEGGRLTLVESVGWKFEVHSSVDEAIVGFTYSIDNARYSKYLDAHGIAP